jgi:Pyridoxamine 5'-phosphate oxidase
MRQEEILEILNKPYSQELLHANIPARLAYIGLDGAPRAIPIGFLWNGKEFVIATPPNAPKLPALQANPKVAMTIDNTAFPPHVLLVRGTATVEIVDGVPDDYIEASRRYVGEAGMPAFVEQVRALYKQMARIAIAPEWANLIDFETTLPSAVEELVNR